MSKIQNVIFDLGGVIINLDFGRTSAAFSSLMHRPFDELFNQHKQDPVFDQLEVGQIEPPVFRDALREWVGSQVSDQEIDTAWNAMLMDIPPHRIEFLLRIGKKKRIFLLSNTNAIHKAAFDQIVAQSYGLLRFEWLFEKAYFSHEIGRRKPDVATFQFVLEENGLSAAETLFIDDSIQHIEGARKAGLEAIHLQKGQEVGDLVVFNQLLAL